MLINPSQLTLTSLGLPEGLPHVRLKYSFLTRMRGTASQFRHHNSTRTVGICGLANKWNHQVATISWEYRFKYNLTPVGPERNCNMSAYGGGVG